MDKIVELSTEEYQKLWDQYKGKLRYSLTGIDPALKKMKVVGSKYKNEYERAIDQRANPPKPKEIEMWTEDGLILYKEKRGN